MARISSRIKRDVEFFIDGFYKEAVTVVTPSSLTKSILCCNKPVHIKTAVWVQSCRWIIHSIIQIENQKRFKHTRSAGFVPLYSAILKKNCGNNYFIFLEGLLKAGVIECDDKYSKKNHESFGFKIADKYASSAISHITLTNPALVKRIKKYRKERIVELKEKAAPIAHLVRWLCNNHLTIDKEAALEFLETYKRRLTSELRSRNLKKKYAAQQESFVLRKYYRIKEQIENWETKKYISIDNAGGRLYSPLTSLPSLFRNFLTYQGEELVGFDIKNSQPLHFLLTLRKKFWKKYGSGLTLFHVDDVLYSWLEDEIVHHLSTIMCHDFAESSYQTGFYKYTFKKLVQDGKLYEFICHYFSNKHFTKSGIDRFNTRAKAKEGFIHMMYHNPKAPYSSAKEVFAHFKEMFPLEASVMEILKKRKYNDFPILLQKIEAQMLLHKVTRKVYNIDANIPLFTIHDSILTIKKHAATLLGVLEAVYQKELGFIPRVEKTSYSQDNAFRKIKEYAETKVDQSNLEIPADNSIDSGNLANKKYEHKNFPQEYYSSIVTPHFTEHHLYPPAFLQKIGSNPWERKLKK